MSHAEPACPRRPLRLWPALVLLALLWILRTMPSWIGDFSVTIFMFAFFGPLVCALLLLLWWGLFSRASGREKTLGLLGVLAIGVVTTLLAHSSERPIGTVGDAIPWGFTAFGVGAVVSQWSGAKSRLAVVLLACLIGFGFWDFVRNDGTWGDFQIDRTWRWSPTAESRFLDSLARRGPVPSPGAVEQAALANPEWPGFRGADRRGVQPGVALGEDWVATPPRELWRGPIGPGWSSFIVAGNRLFTQEQRGDNEVVSCYDASSGAEIWAHAYPARFTEAIGGPGPRATPTLHDGMLFAVGAEGMLLRLDPLTGGVVWQRNFAQDAQREPPDWGYSSSPLVYEDRVVLYAGGAEDRGVLAYDVASGDPLWGAPAGDHSYSSPQLSVVAGQQGVLMASNSGLNLIDPLDGAELWVYDWSHSGYRVLQPLVIDEMSIVMSTDLGIGTRRLKLRRQGERIESEDLWTSRGMKPDFNDYVAHEGYLYGFDRNILACVDLATGERKWKNGRYGHGQLLLLPDADQLLVISERGELVLVRADSAQFAELARFPVLEGKTWNHPVLVGDRLYVRNGKQAAAFEMPVQ